MHFPMLHARARALSNGSFTDRYIVAGARRRPDAIPRGPEAVESHDRRYVPPQHPCTCAVHAMPMLARPRMLSCVLLISSFKFNPLTRGPTNTFDNSSSS